MSRVPRSVRSPVAVARDVLASRHGRTTAVARRAAAAWYAHTAQMSLFPPAPYADAWAAAGLLRGGVAYALVAAPRGNEGLPLWPSPMRHDAQVASLQLADARRNSPGLRAAIWIAGDPADAAFGPAPPRATSPDPARAEDDEDEDDALWPTPTRNDATNAALYPSQMNRKSPGLRASICLARDPNDAAFWPTPTATRGRGYRSGAARATWRPSLDSAVALEDKAVGGAIVRAEHAPRDGKPSPTQQADLHGAPLLSPAFVEALMGLPVGWTDVESST